MNREDFEMLKSGLIYFDNGATTLKPNCVVEEITNYYTKYCANAHRGDYANSIKADTMYEGVRKKLRTLLMLKK